MSVTYRAAEVTDYSAVAAIAKRSDLLLDDLNEANFPRMLRWLYIDPPAEAGLQFVAESDGAIVAHYGGMPVAFVLGGEKRSAAFGSNLVIDKGSRAGMLFISMQSHFARQYRSRGFAFAYGLITRANVLEPHLRAGWKKLGGVYVFAKPVHFPNVAERIIGPSWLRALAYYPLLIAGRIFRALTAARIAGVEVLEAVRFEPDSDTFLVDFTSRFHITAVRSRIILNWRFAAYTERGYRIAIARRSGHVVGYAVTRAMAMKGLETLALVDLAFDPGDEATGRALLGYVDGEAKRCGVDLIATLLNPHSPLIPTLRRSGYLKTPESFTLVVHTPKSPFPAVVDAALFDKWHLTWFDHDYV